MLLCVLHSHDFITPSEKNNIELNEENAPNKLFFPFPQYFLFNGQILVFINIFYALKNVILCNRL